MKTRVAPVLIAVATIVGVAVLGIWLAQGTEWESLMDRVGTVVLALIGVRILTEAFRWRRSRAKSDA